MKKSTKIINLRWAERASRNQKSWLFSCDLYFDFVD